MSESIEVTRANHVVITVNGGAFELRPGDGDRCLRIVPAEVAELFVRTDKGAVDIVSVREEF